MEESLKLFFKSLITAGYKDLDRVQQDVSDDEQLKMDELRSQYKEINSILNNCSAEEAPIMTPEQWKILHDCAEIANRNINATITNCIEVTNDFNKKIIPGLLLISFSRTDESRSKLFKKLFKSTN